MRNQIAAANWKMNLTVQQAETLLNDVLHANIPLNDNQLVIFAVPSPYLMQSNKQVNGRENYFIAAQNCYHQPSGAFTGEVSAEMLKSMGIKYCVVGHSERREYFNESNTQLAEKINLLFKNDIIPIFCCGEPLSVREAEGQNVFVEKQIEESLFHLSADDLGRLIIAYEPIWAIGTGKTASTAQAQDIQQFVRSVIAKKYGADLASNIPILYGGSVKANNAAELFASEDVDGGLVGGASLVAKDFVEIIKALK
jgi:triosephosphate isomerase (TIM)